MCGVWGGVGWGGDSNYPKYDKQSLEDCHEIDCGRDSFGKSIRLLYLIASQSIESSGGGDGGDKAWPCVWGDAGWRANAPETVEPDGFADNQAILFLFVFGEIFIGDAKRRVSPAAVTFHPRIVLRNGGLGDKLIIKNSVRRSYV